MNFDDAILAHIKWKVRLNKFIDGAGSERLESRAVCRDDLCELGKWIYGEGARYESLPQYLELVRTHANFHLCAAEVVSKVDAGDVAGAKALMGGPVALASRETVTAIMGLKNEAAGPVLAHRHAEIAAVPAR